MASTHKHLRSSTANKRPTTSIAEGQIALNTNTTSPGLFFKDSTGATIIKVGPVHVGTTAPNATPPAGGSSGNSTGEVWLDTSLTPNGVKIWNGSAWVNATPVGSTTVQGLLELATDSETQAGSDTARAVTPASLQSKMSDSATTTSATTIASSTAVKTAYDLANAALPRSGGTITGNLEIGTTGSLSFEGSTADGFETTIAVTDPTADRTITLPDTTGTVVTTGDTGTVTSAMIANGTIVDADINASAAIAHSKLANITAGQVLLGNASNVPTATALSGDVTVNSSGVTAISSGVIVNADVNASAAIAGTKISPDFGAQNVTTTGTSTAASFIPTSSTVPTNGVYLPAANSVGISTNGTGRLFVNNGGNIAIGQGTSTAARLLHISTTTAEPALKLSNDTSGHLSGDGADITFTGTNLFITNREAGALIAETNGSERLRITSAGLVGIGTSAPGTILDVNGISRSLGVSISGSSRTGGTAAFDPGTISSDLNWGMYFRANTSPAVAEFAWYNGAGSERMRITSAGNVGIGTSTPSEVLTVEGKVWVGNTSAEPASTSDRADITITNDTGPADILFLDRGLAATRIGVDTNDSGNFKFVTDKEFVWRTGGTSYSGLSTGTERFRCDSSGRLLVGTSTARANFYNGTDTGIFQVEGANDITKRFSSFIYGRDNSDGPLLLLGKHRGTSVGGTTVVASGDEIGRITFQGSDGTQFVAGAEIQAYVDGTPGADDMPGRIVLATTADGASSPTERARITSTGVLGCFSSSDSLLLSTSTAAGTSKALIYGRYGSTFYNDGTNSFTVWTNGNVQNTNNSYGAISDIKLKENIVDSPSQWDDIKALQVRKYNFKEGQTHTQIGLIAQEVELVSPGLVSESLDRDEEGNDLGTVTKSVNYSVLYMKAVKALQEAMERIETLEAKVAALEGA